ncbi:putative receptor like protein 25 [Lactuca sativa]|uniref:putative receptor like protein 25 n=1 Tax=Lactuca sativa TaxID=4236 RepID=UPI000CAD1345|nr:putative receptor like protein 25 [Lactuca sativa]
MINLSNNYITEFHQQPQFLPWKRLEEFSIDNNLLQGQLLIPPQTTVVYIALSNNLTGEIPPLICEVKSLRVLALAFNNMSGTLPPFVGVRTEYEKILTIFTAIELSCNHFEGEIPPSLQDLRGHESLNLSNYHFSGCVLPSLGFLKNLEFGSFPKRAIWRNSSAIGKLNFLSIFNMSFNHLDGCIPKGKQFDTFENDSYMGNPRLCGEPLSKECQGSKATTVPPVSSMYESDSLLPNKTIDWIFVFCGVGSGLVVGVVIGNILYERYNDRFTKRRDIWVRSLSYTRKYQGTIP